MKEDSREINYTKKPAVNSLISNTNLKKSEQSSSGLDNPQSKKFDPK